MKHIIIAILFLLPITLSAQLLRSYGVVEIGSTFPTSTVTGAKFAYRTTDSSYYRWVSGNTWVKIIEPSIIPDTLYLTEEIGTSYKVSGDTINLTPYLLKSDTTAMLVKYIERGDTLGMLSAYIRSAGYGLIKSAYTLRADTTSPNGLATRIFTNRFLLKSDTTTFLAPYIDGFGTTTRIPIFTGNRTIANSPILYNSTTKRTTWDSPGVIELPMGSTAQRPSPATTSDFWYNTTFGPEFYDGSDWYYITPWKQSTSSSNVFLNSGSAIVNTSSVINSNYNLQVNGSATFRNASFTTNEALSGFLDVRGGTMTGQSGTTHGLAGINLSGTMSFNTFNQTLYGIRLNLTTNATANQSVFPFWMHYSANTEGQMQVNNTVGASSFKIGGQNQTNFVTIKTPAGGTGGGALPGITFRAASGYAWAATGVNNGFAINSNAAGTDPNSVNATLLVRGYRAMIGTIISQTPNATLEIQGEGTGNSTTTFLVQNSGRANNAFRIRDDGSARFGGKTMVGADTSFVHDPNSDTTYIKGNTKVQSGNLTVEKASGTPYLNILASATSGNQEAGIYLRSRSDFSPIIEFDNGSVAGPAGRQLSFYNYNTDAGGRTVFIMGSGLGRFGARSIGQFVIYDSLNINQRFAFNSSGLAIFSSYGTGAREATDLSKTQSAYIASWATDGTLLDLSLGSSLKTSGGALDLRHRSLIDSLPLASVTIDAAENDFGITGLNELNFSFENYGGFIETDGDILTINQESEINLKGSDSELKLGTKIDMFAPNTEGAIRFELGDESWDWNYTNDSSAPDSAMTLKTIGDEAYLRLHDYGLGNMNYTVVGEYPSRNIPVFTPTGKVLEMKLTRDTFVEDQSLFSVGLLLYSCDHLFVNTSMTSLASANMEIRFPDAAEVYRGKKITVYSGRKDAGIYVPQIKVAGGVSKLRYTTDPSTSGSMPSDQSALNLDGSTWSYNGTSYEWTCIKIDSTNYRWVLNQR